MAYDFDLVDLRLFLNVDETQSLTRGAQRSHISIPAASARIKKVEEAMAVKLFYRTNTGLMPTSSGQTFLVHAREVLLRVQQMHDALRCETPHLSGQICLHANTLSMGEFVSPAVQRFLLDHPAINIDLHERPSSDIARSVKSGEADLGILSADQAPQDLVLFPYRCEHLVLVTRRGHALAGAPGLRFANALAEDFVGLKEHAALQAFTIRMAHQESGTLKVRIQADSLDALCELVASGIGVGLIPRSVALRCADRWSIAISELEDEWSVRELKVAIKNLSAMSPQARKLLDVLVSPDSSEVFVA